MTEITHHTHLRNKWFTAKMTITATDEEETLIHPGASFWVEDSGDTSNDGIWLQVRTYDDQRLLDVEFFDLDVALEFFTDDVDHLTIALTEAERQLIEEALDAYRWELADVRQDHGDIERAAAAEALKTRIEALRSPR